MRALEGEGVWVWGRRGAEAGRGCLCFHAEPYNWDSRLSDGGLQDPALAQLELLTQDSHARQDFLVAPHAPLAMDEHIQIAVGQRQLHCCATVHRDRCGGPERFRGQGQQPKHLLSLGLLVPAYGGHIEGKFPHFKVKNIGDLALA